MIAVDRAQTVLRYWNWSLSSAMTPALLKAIRDDDEAALDEFSVPAARRDAGAVGADLAPLSRQGSRRKQPRGNAQPAVATVCAFAGGYPSLDLRCGL